MRFACAIACVVTGFDCARTAAGHAPQWIFSPDAIWLWGWLGVAWVAVGIHVLFKGAA